MIDSFNSLRHNTIISGNNNNCDISDLCTTCTHGCKSLMSWCIEESYLASVLKDNPVCTDMLRNPSSLTCNYIGIPDIVKQLCFTMVNMPHYSNNRRPWFKIFL